MSEQVDTTAARRNLAVVVTAAARRGDLGAVTMPATQVLGVSPDLADVKLPIVHGERDAGVDIKLGFAIDPGASARLGHAEGGPG